MSGKFLHGVFCGISIICVGQALNETIPSDFLQAYGILTNGGITGGIFMSNFLGALLPLEEDGAVKMMSDGNWRIVYGFPILLALFSLLVISISIKEFSVVSLLKKAEDKPRAIYAICKVYTCVDPEQKYEELKSENSIEEPEVSVLESLTNPMYRYASWNSLALSVYH